MDAQKKLMHSRIWELLSDYADIREEIEDILSGFRCLYDELETTLEDLASDLDDLDTHLLVTGKTLRRYRRPEPVCVLPWQDTDFEEKEALPWN